MFGVPRQSVTPVVLIVHLGCERYAGCDAGDLAQRSGVVLNPGGGGIEVRPRLATIAPLLLVALPDMCTGPREDRVQGVHFANEEAIAVRPYWVARLETQVAAVIYRHQKISA